MSAVIRAHAKILFCDVRLLCNLATEFNGLVSKQDWLFLRPVLFIFDSPWLSIHLSILLKINEITK